MGYTDNSIAIDSDIDTVFSITNNINAWKFLFSEYKESKVLKREGNKITFQLTTYPDEERESRTWISERIIDRKLYTCSAKRLEPKYPFEYMNIYWKYEKGEEGSTVMRWIQDFKPHEECPWDDKKLEKFIDKNTKIQMEIIKEKIENGFELN